MIQLMGMKNRLFFVPIMKLIKITYITVQAYFLNCDSYVLIDGHEKQAIHFVPIMKLIKITYITVQDYFSEL